MFGVPKRHLCLIGGVFAVVNAGTFAAGGVRYGSDSARYLRGAVDLLALRRLHDKAASYLGYVIIVAVSRVTHTGVAGVVALQLAGTAGASLLLYQLGRRMGGDRVALAAALFYVGNPWLARWNWYVLTEAPYIAAVVLAVTAVERADRRRDVRSFATALVALLAAALMRPTGWILLPVAACFLSRSAFRRKAVKWLSWAGVAIAFLGIAAAIPAFRGGIQNERPEVLLRRGDTLINWAPWRIHMPQDASTEEGWVAGLRYVARHPFHSALVGMARVGIAIASVRPYYSVKQNIALVAYLTPVIALAFIGAASRWRAPLTRLVVAVVGAQLLVIALTLADEDGRYFAYSLPLIGLLAATGLGRFLAPTE